MAKSASQPAAKPGQNPKFSKTEQALVDQANAKASGKILDTRPSKGPTPVTKVASAAADGATEKAPHTKRAIQQNAEAAKVAKAETKLADATTALTAAEAAFGKLKAKYRKDTQAQLAKRADLTEATAAKVKAEQAFLAAKKALAALKHEQLTPEERAAKAPKVATPKAKAAPAPRADKAYKVLNKDHGARPDSKRAKQLEIVFKHKSTEAAKAAGAESVDFQFAIAKGFIQYV